MSDRARQFGTFVADALARAGVAAAGPWRSITGDASFRHFHRVPLATGSWVAVDAPPATENNAQYLAIAERWRAAGLPLPRIHAHDLANGFFLVEDFGDRLLASALDDAGNATAPLYRAALDLTNAIQALPLDGTCPPYARSRFEMELGIFREWFLDKALGHALTAEEVRLLADCEQTLLAAIAAQPAVTVHRDWHSRNLLVRADGTLGIIDFQDALVGPYVYDVVSLLRDCYRRIDDDAITAHLDYYVERAAPAIRARSREQIVREFDLTGMQRHLKAIGIFARLWRRDGRTGYLPDIPRVLGYLRDVAARHDDLHAFGTWITATIEPAWNACARSAGIDTGSNA